MEKLSSSLIKATMGGFMLNALKSLPEVKFERPTRDPRGRAPAGRRWVIRSWQMPRPTKIRNPKVAANVQMMFERWLTAKMLRDENFRLQYENDHVK